MAKRHGSLTRAGKVKSNTPKVDKLEKARSKTGRAMMRNRYTRYFLKAKFSPAGKRLGPNNMAYRV